MTSIVRAILLTLLSATSAAAADEVFPDDRSMGSAKAPVQIIEYVAPVCPHCAHFSATVLPELKKTYIDTGKVHYVLRIYPLSPYDGAVAGMASCLPKKRYFEFLSLAFAKQALWRPNELTADPMAGLVALGGLVGLEPEQVSKCIVDEKESARVNRIAEDGEKRYNVQSVPTVIVNGTEVPERDWPSLQNRIKTLLAGPSKTR